LRAAHQFDSRVFWLPEGPVLPHLSGWEELKTTLSGGEGVVPAVSEDAEEVGRSEPVGAEGAGVSDRGDSADFEEGITGCRICKLELGVPFDEESGMGSAAIGDGLIPERSDVAVIAPASDRHVAAGACSNRAARSART